MDGVHDMGGKKGFGLVSRVGQGAGAVAGFSHRWEAAVFAMSGIGPSVGAWNNSDRFRHAVERIEPEAYLKHGYYGRWLGGIETLLVEAGIVSQVEITDRARELGANERQLIAAKPLEQPDPLGALASTPGSERPIEAKAAFSLGDRVITRSEIIEGHSRLPAYARDKAGLIVASHGGWVFPDTNAHGLGESPQHLYTVEFDSEDLDQGKGFTVCLDLFEPYLCPRI